MSLAASLPFCPGDWIRRKADGRIARVRECSLRAECPDGVFTVVRYQDSGEHRAVMFMEFEPLRGVPARPVLRLVSFNPHIIPSPRKGMRLSHPAHASVVDAGCQLPAPSGAATPCAQGSAPGATLFTDYSRPLREDDILQAAILETIRRHTEGEHHAD